MALVQEDGVRGRLRKAWDPLVGWGLLTAWGLVGRMLDLGPMPGPRAFSSAVISLTCVLTCLGVWVAGRRGWQPRPDARRSVWALAIAMAVLSLVNQLLLRAGWAAGLSFTLQVGSSVLYVLFMYRWFLLYVPLDPQIVEERAIWSTALCALVLLAAVFLVPVARVALWASLPIFSALCLNAAVHCRREMAAREGSSAVDNGDLLGDPSSQLRRGKVALLVGIVLCGFAVMLPQDLHGSTAVGYQSTYLSVAELGGLLVAAVLVLWCTVRASRIDLQNFFRVLYPLVAIGSFLVVTPHIGVATAGLALGCAAQWVLYMFVWIYAVEACGRRRTSPAASFATLRAAFEGGTLVAALFATPVALELERGVPLAELLLGTVAFFALTAALPLGASSPDDELTCAPPPGMTPYGAIVDGRRARLSSAFGLSEREAQILGYLLKGYSTTSIRNDLGIAKGTVDSYIQRIYRKCGVHSRQELVELAEKGDAGS